VDDIPGLVICAVCSRSGPGVDEIVALPDELEAEAIGAGWRWREGWICPTCIEGGVSI
jgi:hypothetical protein